MAITDLPGLTYTRTGAATAWRKDGTLVEFAPNIPRITDAGVTIEGQRTNLFARWDPTADQLLIRPNAADATEPSSAPIVGRKWLALNNSAATATAYQSYTASPSTKFSMQVLVETPDGTQPVAAALATGGDFSFVVGGFMVSPAFFYRKLAGNVWLVSATGDSPASPSTSCGIVRYATHSTRPLKFSGFQLELGTRASTPIITTGAAATVGADNLALAKTIVAGEDFTAVGSAVFLGNTGLRLIALDGGSEVNMIRLGRATDGATMTLTVTASGTDYARSLPNVAGANPVKYAIRRSGQNVVAVLNGGAITAPVAPSLPSLTTLFVGRSREGNVSDALTKEFTFFPYALSDADLLRLTQ